MTLEEQAYADGQRVRVSREAYEVASDDAPESLAFWDGYYGRPLRRRS